MPHQIVVSCTFLANLSAEFPDSTQLVEAWEDDHGTSVFIIIAFDEVLQKVKNTVGLKDVLPHIAHRVFSFYRWIGAVLVEGQEFGFYSVQAGGHKDIVVVHHKMYQTMTEHPVLRVTLVAILIDTVSIVLPRTLILQFESEEWQAVEQDAHVQLVTLVGTSRTIAHLTHDTELV
ncbi:hypothetical protein RG252_11160 [Prevotella bryantii]|nr:hypothetical protein [Segatella bryantii]MDR4931807.1 hypothetical protein [Segatella bryantii]